MPTKSINITLDREVLAQLDLLVAGKRYANRSRMIEEAIKEKLQTL
ncbi:MAG: ribbon-helix-helix domain-containing protein, partial [Xenococcus sp. (in: cyanobacteria)]